MNAIITVIKTVLPAKRKMTPTGWESFNAVCCHHRGEKPDTRKRGGVIFKGDGFTYHCFNCNFKAGWSPGHLLSKNTQSLLSWLGVLDNDIKRLTLDAIKNKNDEKSDEKTTNLALEVKDLPPGTQTIDKWASDGCTDLDFIAVVEYILKRGMNLDWYDWMWSNEPGYSDRVIIPFYYNNSIVGWSARKITDGNPKYLAASQPSYVFNLDNQTEDKSVVIVVEGVLDAISIDAIAVMGNELNSDQILRIMDLRKEVILVPDQDRAGSKLIKTAIEHGWSVSLPEWGNDVKDVADAVKKYGRIYTLFTIMNYKVHGEIKLTMIRKKIENAANK